MGPFYDALEVVRVSGFAMVAASEDGVGEVDADLVVVSGQGCCNLVLRHVCDVLVCAKGRPVEGCPRGKAHIDVSGLICGCWRRRGLFGCETVAGDSRVGHGVEGGSKARRVGEGEGSESSCAIGNARPGYRGC